MNYYFIFGNHPELSKAEIFTKLKQLNIDFQIYNEASNFIILDITKDFDATELIRSLAGTVKLGKILNSFDHLTPSLIADLINSDKKINFGLSYYNFNVNNPKKFGLQVKSLLKEKSVKSRYVSGQTNPLSSVIVEKNLIKDGLELVILKNNDKKFIGQTLAVQPFELFSELDYDRPNKDLYSGMLPLKLAQIMINLSGAKFESTILDPFCGSGTILQQALFLGYKNIIGTDISEKAIEDSTKNLQWYKQNFHSDANYKIKKISTLNLTKNFEPNSINAIITEPYLGPALKGYESIKEIQTNILELEKLYRNSLLSFDTILKKSGTVVMIIPEFKINNINFKINFNKLIEGKFKINSQFKYSRPDQFIVRNIFVLSKI